MPLVEPIPELVKRSASIERQRGQLCSEHQRGCGELLRRREYRADVDARSDSRSSRVDRAGRWPVKEITVRTATLDSLLAEADFPEIQFITIDVEA